MERVSTLIKKLQSQLDEKASANMLLHTVQMLQAELQSQSAGNKDITQDKVSVIMPVFFNINQAATGVQSKISEEKIIEVLKSE